MAGAKAPAASKTADDTSLLLLVLLLDFSNF